MRFLATIFCILTFLSPGFSQDLIKQIDSLINTIESSENFISKSRCDTSLVSHSDYFYPDCIFYSSFEGKLIRIVQKNDRFKLSSFYDSLYKEKPKKTGTIYLNTFYFYNDTLIKAIRADYDPVFIITHFYFTGNDLAKMEEQGWKGTDKYKRTENCIGLGYSILNYFKRNK